MQLTNSKLPFCAKPCLNCEERGRVYKDEEDYLLVVRKLAVEKGRYQVYPSHLGLMPKLHNFKAFRIQKVTSFSHRKDVIQVFLHCFGVCLVGASW